MCVLSSTSQLRELLSDSHAAVRQSALLGLLETGAAIQQEVRVLAEKDVDTGVREVTNLWLKKRRELMRSTTTLCIRESGSGSAISAAMISGATKRLWNMCVLYRSHRLQMVA